MVPDVGLEPLTLLKQLHMLTMKLPGRFEGSWQSQTFREQMKLPLLSTRAKWHSKSFWTYMQAQAKVESKGSKGSFLLLLLPDLTGLRHVLEPMKINIHIVRLFLLFFSLSSFVALAISQKSIIKENGMSRSRLAIHCSRILSSSSVTATCYQEFLLEHV